MSSKQIHLFATRHDLERGIRSIETRQPLKYALCGMFQSPDPRIWCSVLDVENLGKAPNGNQSLCERYLVMQADAELQIRNVAQSSGGTRYAVDQLHNPASIVFQPGGAFGDGYLICGHIGTASNHPDAVRLFREFSRSVTREFRKHRDYFVGPEAINLRAKGVRLITMHVEEAKEYDLDVPSTPSEEV
jgi:hypothetical protein